MDQSRWKIVADIFHSAIDLPEKERSDFVLRASGGDAAIQQEVQSLLVADALAGDYIEAPIVGPQTVERLFQPLHPVVAPGEVLCGRFRILRSVGRGGMGEIFEAYDAELSVRVALKTIRPDIAANPYILSRFRQEVRLARQITHPNVCRTFDLERDTRPGNQSNGAKDEIVFLTMEFLEGESLAARIKREGALKLDEAFAIARQLASGLEAAGLLGVVHRDIKPGNIMLVSGESGTRAVITDFGLAYAETVDVAKTLSGIGAHEMPLGTLAYMSPEQLEGRSVTTATDTYAFGLVLFEMVTGQQAFPARTLLSGIARRLSGQLPDPSEIVPSLPESWKNTIRACLAMRTEDRSRLEDAIAALQNHPAASRIRLFERQNSTGVQRWFQNRLLLMSAVVVLAVTLFYSGLRYWGLRGSAEVSPGALVYLAPIRNDTGEPGLDGVGELIRASLSQSARINLLESGRVGDTLERMTKPPNTEIDQPIAREIALRNGAVRVVFVDIRHSGGTYLLHMDVQQPDSSPRRYRKQWEKSFEWQSPVKKGAGMTIPADLLTAVRDSSDWVRNEIGESRNDVARLDSPPEDVTTGNWEALVGYQEALRLESTGQHDRAVEMLRDVVTLDSRFSLAFARLGDILVSIGRYREGFDAYAQALNTDAFNRLTHRERDRIKGIYASDTEDYETAEIAFRDYATYYENDYLGWFYRALPLRMLERDDEALESLRRALAVAPDSLAARATIIDQLIVMGHFDEAQERIKKLKAAGELYEATWREGDIAFLNGDFRQAEQDYRFLGSSPDRRLRGFSSRMLSRLAAERGDAESAIRILELGIDDDLAHGDDSERASALLDIAYLEHRLGRDQQAIGTITLALKIDHAPQSFIKASRILGQAFQMAPPRTRNLIRATLVDLEHRFADAHFGMISQRTNLRLRGEALLSLGRTDDAIKVFEQLIALQPSADERECLGRAYEVAAQTEQQGPRSAEWNRNAHNAYAKIATRPSFAWSEALHYPPGFLGDQIWSYLHSASDSNISKQDSAAALRFFSKLRPKQFSDAPDLVHAHAQLNSSSSQSPTQGDQQ